MILNMNVNLYIIYLLFMIVCIFIYDREHQHRSAEKSASSVRVVDSAQGRTDRLQSAKRQDCKEIHSVRHFFFLRNSFLIINIK